MADFAASVLAPVVESGVKYVVGVIKRQFIYLCCFVSNIAALRDEAQNLDDIASEMLARVNAAENDVQKIKPEIVTWLRDTNDIKEKTTTILNEVPNGCLARFSLSRSAVKTSEAMTQHREKCKLFGDDIFMAPSSAASKPTPLGTTYEFESRKQTEQNIMIALRDNEEENMIGICGMGGLGKTTMAKRIMNRALEAGIFQEVVITVVSQTIDELRMQVEIGGSLGLKDLEKETPQGRVQKLYERITSSTKRILIVLDDVWKNIKLKELGIPCRGDSKGCRILITSRNGDALKAMGVKMVFGLKQLSKEDAWFLFKENAGTCVEDIELNSVAKQVVSKCKGLPIAIEIVGASLKDERSKSVWKDALKQLKEPNPKNIQDFMADIYKPMIVSYDKLDNDEVKSLFLLCCLFPEDGNILIEKLVILCMGLRIFEDMRSVEEVRDRVCALVKRLKTRSLLLDSEKKDCVRMHDVVRDIGIFTRKQKEKSGGSNGTWISSNELTVGEETYEISSLNLRLLLSADDKIKIENTYFEGMRDLYVLVVVNHSWALLPQLPESLKSIRTLVLDSCKDLETLSGVGGLVNLEILICCNCSKIEELPHEIGVLKHLKVLELSGCYNVKNIAPGIISSLVELEELMMLSSFSLWAVDNGSDENRYAKLGELESLTKLTCLEINVADCKLVSQQIKLSTNIKRFDIQFNYYTSSCPKGLSKKLYLTLDRGTCIGHWVENLIKDTEYLYIEGNGANDLDLAKINPNIRYLKLAECDSMKYFGDDGRHTLFQHMEGLELSSLPLLQEVWNGPVSSNSFQNIKKIRINDLPALKQLGKSNSTSVSLPQLDRLEIKGCGMMEQLFQWSEEEEEDENAAEIDQHNYLHLFCQQQKVSFGRLKKLVMDRNPFCRHIGDIHASSFIHLEELYISKCDGNSSLFTPPIARNLTNLRKLSISDCDEMIRVIEDENEDDEAVGSGRLLFPQLLEIELKNLSKLVSFGKWKCDADADELPPLRRLIITGCSNMPLPLVPTLHSEFIRTDLSNYDLNAPENAFHHQIPLFSFHGLRYLVIDDYRGGMCIFSSSVACNLSNLRSLWIRDCNEMVKVIQVKEEERVASASGGRWTTTLLFPNLQQLSLWTSHKLEKFGEWKHNVELPLLKNLYIYKCRQMRKFALGSIITTPLLKSIYIDSTEHILDASTDLNDLLLQHYLTQQKESMEMEMWEEMEMEMKEWMGMEMEMWMWMWMEIEE